jgi:hypothetical protein
VLKEEVSEAFFAPICLQFDTGLVKGMNDGVYEHTLNALEVADQKSPL